MKKKYIPVTEDDFAEMMSRLENKKPNIKASMEESAKFMDQVAPYLNMTKEQMEANIPAGAYEIRNNGMIVWTGKGGFINVILNVQKQLNIKP